MSEVGQNDPYKSRIGSFGDFTAGFSTKIQAKKEPTLEASDFASSKPKRDEVIEKGLKSFGSLCKILLLDVPTLGIGNVLGRLIGTGIRELRFPRNAQIDKEGFNLARSLGKGIANPLRETKEDLVATKALFREIGACVINAITSGNRYDSPAMTLDMGKKQFEKFKEEGLDITPALENSIANPDQPSIFHLMTQEDKIALLAEVQPKAEEQVKPDLSPRHVQRSKSESTPLRRLTEPVKRMATGEPSEVQTTNASEPRRRKIAKAKTEPIGVSTVRNRFVSMSKQPKEVKLETTYRQELTKIHHESNIEQQAPTDKLAKYLLKNRDDPKAVEIFIRHGIEEKVNFGGILDICEGKIDREDFMKKLENMKKAKLSEPTSFVEEVKVAEVESKVESKKPQKNEIYEKMKQFYKLDDRIGLKHYINKLSESERNAVYDKIESKASFIWNETEDDLIENPKQSKKQEMWDWFNYQIDRPIE